MVSKKATKTAKRSYAERVLGAINQVQREHRRHSVHLATLRAQVRKNAEAKRDKLGPQWSQWVGKAVHKLTEEGILENAEPTGNVTLTPMGKKVISTALKASPNQDDLVWKHVANASRGIKRPRVSGNVSSDGDLGQSEENNSVSVVRLKRTKGPNSARVRRPVMKPMTPQVQSPLAKRVRDRSLSRRPSSPLTDLDDEEDATVDNDEVNRLRAELQKKDNELGKMRHELSEMKQQAISGIHSAGSSRYASPDLTINFNAPSSPSPGSPGPSHTADTPRVHRVTKGITRTQSGSIIPNVSKQPTPAPSVSGGEEDGDMVDEHMDTDFFGLNGLEPHRSLQQLETPISSPDRAVMRVKELQGTNLTLRERVVNLQEEMEQRDALIVGLQKENDDLQVSQAEGSCSLTVKDSELESVRKDLSEQLNLFERRLAERDARITVLDEEVRGLNGVLFGLREISAEEQSSLQDRLNCEVGQHSAARFEVQKHLATITGVRLTLQELQLQHKILNANLSDEREKNNHLSEQLHDAEAKNESLLLQITSVQDESRSFRDTKAKQDGIIAKLAASFAESKKEEQLLRDKASDLEKTSQAYQSGLAEAKVMVEELNAELEGRQAELVDLTSQILQANLTNEETSMTLAESQAAVASLNEELKESRKVAENAEASLKRVSEELGRGREQHQRLMGELRGKEDQLVEEQGKSAMVGSVAEKLREELVAKGELVESLSKRVGEAEDRVQVAEDSLVASETRHAAASRELIAEISTLEQARFSIQKDVDRVKSQLRSAELDHEETRARLVGEKAERLKVHMELDLERSKAGSLDKDLMIAMGKVHELEAEVMDIRAAKELDEGAIQTLRYSFEQLREIQSRSLADMERKVASAQPTPIRRRQPANETVTATAPVLRA